MESDGVPSSGGSVTRPCRVWLSFDCVAAGRWCTCGGRPPVRSAAGGGDQRRTCRGWRSDGVCRGWLRLRLLVAASGESPRTGRSAVMSDRPASTTGGRRGDFQQRRGDDCSGGCWRHRRRTGDAVRPLGRGDVVDLPPVRAAGDGGRALARELLPNAWKGEDVRRRIFDHPRRVVSG